MLLLSHAPSFIPTYRANIPHYVNRSSKRIPSKKSTGKTVVPASSKPTRQTIPRMRFINLMFYFTLLLLFFFVPKCPVCLHNKEELLADERTIFVIHDLAVPSHPVRDALYLN